MSIQDSNKHIVVQFAVEKITSKTIISVKWFITLLFIVICMLLLTAYYYTRLFTPLYAKCDALDLRAKLLENK